MCDRLLHLNLKDEQSMSEAFLEKDEKGLFGLVSRMFLQCGYFLLQAIRDTGKDPFLRDAPLTAHGRMQAQEAQEKLRELQEDSFYDCR